MERNGNYATAANSYASALDQAPPQLSQLHSVEEELSQLRNRLAQSTGELGSIADRVFGTQPQPVGDPKTGHPMGGGVLSAIGSALLTLALEIDAIEERTKRLSAL